jgi:hypothetical protein
MISFPSPSDDLLNELREKHGDDMREVEDQERMFVLVKPEKPYGYVDRFMTLAGNDKKRLESFTSLVKACCVYPDKETLKRVLDDEPGMALSLGDPATELLGIRQLTVKK